MWSYCILTVLGSYYLTLHNSYDGIVTLEPTKNEELAKWTLVQDEKHGEAFQICSTAYPKYCLGVGTSRKVQDLESIIVTDVKDEFSDIYWKYNATQGSLQPTTYENFHLYMIGVNTTRIHKPVQFWEMDPFDSNMNYAAFKFQVC